MSICEACAKAKAHQKTLSSPQPTDPANEVNTGERRIYLDIATLKTPASSGTITNNNWRIMVDEATQLKFLAFCSNQD